MTDTCFVRKYGDNEIRLKIILLQVKDYMKGLPLFSVKTVLNIHTLANRSY